MHSVELQVVNVGDGACSIIDDGEDAMVLDCGSWHSRKGLREAYILSASLGRRLRRVSTLAVSHFDQDHWRGLKSLASVADSDLLPDEITVHYPGLSQLAEKIVAAYLRIQSLDSGISFEALDLKSAWEAVVPAVRIKPLFEGDQLTVGAQTYEVLWPPRELDPVWSRAAALTLDQLHELAVRIPGLAEGLAEAYDAAWSTAGQEDARERFERRQRPVRNGESLLGGAVLPAGGHYESLYIADDVDIGGGVGDFFANEDHVLSTVDSQDLERLRRLAKRLANLNNHLSLVFQAMPQEGFYGDGLYSWLLTLGDTQGWSLSRIQERLLSHYCVSLAPHHGTVQLPASYPHICTCVLQNGKQHFEKRSRHINSPGHGSRDLSTHAAGSSQRLHFQTSVLGGHAYGCCCA